MGGVGNGHLKVERVKGPDTNRGSISLEDLGLVVSMENRLDVTTNVC